MLHRPRNTWLAGGGALLLVLSISGLAGAANLVSDTTTGTQDATTPAGGSPTVVAFVDLNGNGIDDSCETGVVTPDPVAAAAALAAADLNGDGTISVSEAAQSGWIGGKNCNHGGYVSSVAKTSTDTCDETNGTGSTTDQSAGDARDSQDSTDSKNEDAADQTTNTSTTTVTTPTTTVCSQPSTNTSTTAPTTTVCPVVTPVAPILGATPPDVSTVAQSAAVGGKNCNHGGAVSEAAKAAHGLKADKTAKRAAHLAKHHGKGHKH